MEENTKNKWGWTDTDYAIQNWNSNVDCGKKLEEWVYFMKDLAETKCLNNDYREGVIRRCEEFIKTGK